MENEEVEHLKEGDVIKWGKGMALVIETGFRIRERDEEAVGAYKIKGLENEKLQLNGDAETIIWASEIEEKISKEEAKAFFKEE